MTSEQKPRTVEFCLKLSVINNLIALLVIKLGCVNSGFTCQGEAMKDVLSLYAFTVFFPQLALGAILLMALLLASNSLQDFRDHKWWTLAMITTFALLIWFGLSM